MRIFIFLCFLLNNPGLNGQSVKSVLDAMVSMDQGFLDKTLAPELVFISEGADIGISKPEGVAQLKSYLFNHRIKSYRIIHEGVSKGRGEYMGIGGIVTDKGKLRIYISFKSITENKFVVSEVRLEKDLL